MACCLLRWSHLAPLVPPVSPSNPPLTDSIPPNSTVANFRLWCDQLAWHADLALATLVWFGLALDGARTLLLLNRLKCRSKCQVNTLMLSVSVSGSVVVVLLYCSCCCCCCCFVCVWSALYLCNIQHTTKHATKAENVKCSSDRDGRM